MWCVGSFFLACRMIEFMACNGQQLSFFTQLALYSLVEVFATTPMHTFFLAYKRNETKAFMARYSSM